MNRLFPGKEAEKGLSSKNVVRQSNRKLEEGEA